MRTVPFQPPMQEVFPAVGCGNVIGIIQIAIGNRYAHDLAASSASGNSREGLAVNLIESVARFYALKTDEQFRDPRCVVSHRYFISGTYRPDCGGRRIEPDFGRARIDEGLL